MSNQNTLRNRLSEHVGTVAEAESIVFDHDAPSIPASKRNPLLSTVMQSKRSARSKT